MYIEFFIEANSLDDAQSKQQLIFNLFENKEPIIKEPIEPYWKWDDTYIISFTYSDVMKDVELERFKQRIGNGWIFFDTQIKEHLVSNTGDNMELYYDYIHMVLIQEE